MLELQNEYDAIYRDSYLKQPECIKKNLWTIVFGFENYYATESLLLSLDHFFRNFSDLQYIFSYFPS